MKTRRTPWWQYVIGAVLGLLAGIGLASYGESSGLSLIGAPWIVPGLLAVLGVIVLILALQVHKYANTDPKKRPHSFINPTIAGATLAGWYGGQIVVSLSHIEADFYAHAVTECAIAAVVCIADMIIGIIGEWLCQLPPNEGPENPKIREAKRRSDIAQAYKR